MDAALPEPLSLRLASLCEGRSGRLLTEKAQAISESYRSGAPSSRAIRDEQDALAYALTRMPATYAATRAALEALAVRAPGFTPSTLADIGCGPGTASWAALDTFGALSGLTLVDRDPFLLDLAERLLDPEPVAKAFGRSELADAAIPRSDLVVAAYVLAEMPNSDAIALAAKLWDAAAGALVIIEPGTPRGWAGLMEIRSILIDRNAEIAAPCPHMAACPITAPDWCHFAQRLPRSRAHRLGKAADAPFEDEKFAYLAAVRPGSGLSPTAPRILALPRRDKAAISLKLCMPAGALELRRIGSRDKTAFRNVRRAGWGDRVGD